MTRSGAFLTITTMLLLLFCSSTVFAASVDITSVRDWEVAGAPSLKRDTSLPEWDSTTWISGTWVGRNRGEPEKRGNSSGSLVSDFILIDDFVFTGLFSPTIANNHSCEVNNVCNDNDIVGLVFGWQNEDNHFRIGWSQADDSKDITGKSGLFLVEEKNGISTTLLNWDLYWIDDAVYDFTISVTNSILNVDLLGLISDMMGDQTPLTPAVSQNIVATSMSFATTLSNYNGGKIGVYSESQTAVFSNMSYSGLILVNTPTTFGILIIALWLVVQSHKRLSTHSLGKQALMS